MLKRIAGETDVVRLPQVRAPRNPADEFHLGKGIDPKRPDTVDTLFGDKVFHDRKADVLDLAADVFQVVAIVNEDRIVRLVGKKKGDVAWSWYWHVRSRRNGVGTKIVISYDSE